MDEFLYQCWLSKRKEFLDGLKPDGSIPGVCLSVDDIKNSKKLRFWSRYTDVTAYMLFAVYFFSLFPALYAWVNDEENVFPLWLVLSAIALLVLFIFTIIGAFHHSRYSQKQNILVRLGKSRVTLTDLAETEHWTESKPWHLLLDSLNQRIGVLRSQQTVFMKAAFTLGLTFFITLLLGVVFQEIIATESALLALDPDSENARALGESLSAMLESVPPISIFCIIFTAATVWASYGIWLGWLWTKNLSLSKLEEFRECIEMKIAQLESDAPQYVTKSIVETK